jgi:hypothetical protein
VFGIQATFLEIADSVPGFAGVFIGPDQRLRMAVTPSGNGAAALAALHRRYDRTPSAPLMASIEEARARYDYRQLYDWKEAIETAMARRGAIAFGIHVTTNTVDVYSPAPDVDAAILDSARADNIPTDAIRIVRSGSASYLADLKDAFRPGVPGSAGIQLATDVGCTLGLNVKLTSTAAWAGLTAAHCTATIGGGADGTTIDQGGGWPNSNSSDRIGHEIADPTWSTSGCDGSYTYCRSADVAVMGYTSTPVADSGYIAVTTGRNTTSTTWISKDSTSRYIDGVWSDQPFEGATLDHVGVVSGWHSGTVVSSCSDWQVGDPGYSSYEWQCQTVVSGLASHGDSGGPVFSQLPGKNVMFAGLVSRYGSDTTQYVFSSYPNICVDLGGCPYVNW